jgi:hypothetical protein
MPVQSRNRSTHATILPFLLFAALFCSHLYFSWRLYTVRHEIKAFHERRGLIPTDDHRLTVSLVDIGVSDRWRFYGEKRPDRELIVCAVTEDIDRWPRRDNVRTAFVEASYTIKDDKRIVYPHFTVDAHLRRTDGGTRLAFRTGMYGEAAVPSDHPLHQRSLEELTVEILPDRPLQDGMDTPCVLMRITDPTTPGRGLVMWVEDYKKEDWKHR